MVNLADFSNVYATAFALNVFVTYIDQVRRRRSEAMTDALSQTLQEFEIGETHRLHARKIQLESAVTSRQHRLTILARVMAVLTLTSSCFSLALLILIGFAPHFTTASKTMAWILLAILGLPLLTYVTTSTCASIWYQQTTELISDAAPDFEMAGLNKQGVIRFATLGRRRWVTSVRSTNRFVSLLHRALNRLRGRTTIQLDEDTSRKLQELSARNHKDPGTTMNEMFSFMHGIIENPDNYTPMPNESGVLVPKLNREIIEEIRERNKKKRLQEQTSAGIPGED